MAGADRGRGARSDRGHATEKPGVQNGVITTSPIPFDASAGAGAHRVSDRRARAERVYLDLVGTYQTAILNYIWRMVGDTDVAEDLTQDTFLKAWRALDRLELGDGVEAMQRAWLYRIAHNCAADHLRRKARIGWFSLDALRAVGREGHGLGPGPARQVELREPVDRALAALSEDHRQALLLFNHHGLRADEVAGILGISEAAARKRRQRARAAFEEAYERFAGVETASVGEGQADREGDGELAGGSEGEGDRDDGGEIPGGSVGEADRDGDGEVPGGSVGEGERDRDGEGWGEHKPRRDANGVDVSDASDPGAPAARSAGHASGAHADTSASALSAGAFGESGTGGPA